MSYQEVAKPAIPTFTEIKKQRIDGVLEWIEGGGLMWSQGNFILWKRETITSVDRPSIPTYTSVDKPTL